MEDKVKTDILNVLDNSSKMIERDDMTGLKELSNHTIHNASIFQDEDSVTIAVIMYTLAKIFERENKAELLFVPIINNAKRNLFENKISEYKENLKKLYELIKNRDSKNKLYVQEVFEQAGVKKSSKIYEHGVSMGQAASILGISQWELMEYIGKTSISDSFEPQNLKKRLSTARKLFGG
jgi:hypothetical protein